MCLRTLKNPCNIFQFKDKIDELMSFPPISTQPWKQASKAWVTRIIQLRANSELVVPFFFQACHPESLVFLSSEKAKLSWCGHHKRRVCPFYMHRKQVIYFVIPIFHSHISWLELAVVVFPISSLHWSRKSVIFMAFGSFSVQGFFFFNFLMCFMLNPSYKVNRFIRVSTLLMPHIRY